MTSKTESKNVAHLQVGSVIDYHASFNMPLNERLTFGIIVKITGPNWCQLQYQTKEGLWHDDQKQLSDLVLAKTELLITIGKPNTHHWVSAEEVKANRDDRRSGHIDPCDGLWLWTFHEYMDIDLTGYALTFDRAQKRMDTMASLWRAPSSRSHYEP